MKNKKLDEKIKRRLRNEAIIKQCEEQRANWEIILGAQRLGRLHEKAQKDAQLLRDRESLFQSPELKSDKQVPYTFKNPVSELLESMKRNLEKLKIY